MAKRDSLVDVGKLEYTIREELNRKAVRVMGVLRPLRVVVTNYPEGQVEDLDAENNPEDPAAGTRKLKFSRTLYIEQTDFMEDPPKKFFRLAPGREVRLKHAYLITCQEVIKNDAGEVVELRCTYDPETRGGDSLGRKVRGTLHWVSAEHAVSAEVRLYDHLFSVENPLEGGTFKSHLNPDSLETLAGCRLEASLAGAGPADRYQFLRHGYFCLDRETSADGGAVFNRTVALRDTWAKLQKGKK